MAGKTIAEVRAGFPPFHSQVAGLYVQVFDKRQGSTRVNARSVAEAREIINRFKEGTDYGYALIRNF